MYEPLTRSLPLNVTVPFTIVKKLFDAFALTVSTATFLAVVALHFTITSESIV